MDGSETVFKAVTNSGLATLIEDTPICGGCTLVVKDYTWIWMSSPNSVEWHAIMLIKNMGWNYPPHFNEESFPPVMLTPPRPTKKVKNDEQMSIPTNNVKPRELRMYWDVLDHCDSSAMFTFTYVLTHNPARYKWDQPTSYRAPMEHFVAGDWIQSPETRCDWAEWCVKRMPADKKHWVLPLFDDSTRRSKSGNISDDATVADECQCQSKYHL